MNRFRYLIFSFVALAASIACPSLTHAATGQTGGTFQSLTRSFTSTSTDTVPSWASRASFLYCGGGAASDTGGTPSAGGSGACWELSVPVVANSSITFTIGAGGATSRAAGGTTTVTGAGLGRALPPACGGNWSSTNGNDGGYGGGGCNGNSAPNTAYFTAAGAITGSALSGFWPGQNGAGNSTGNHMVCVMTGVDMGTSIGGCSRVGTPSTSAPTGYAYGGSYIGASGFGAGGGGYATVTYYQQ